MWSVVLTTDRNRSGVDGPFAMAWAFDSTTMGNGARGQGFASFGQTFAARFEEPGCRFGRQPHRRDENFSSKLRRMPWRIRSSQSVGDDRILSARASVRRCAADPERGANVFRRQEWRSLFRNGRLGWNAVGCSDLASRYFFKQSKISSGAGGRGMESEAVSRYLFEDEMSHGALEVPIDHGERSQIERRVHNHQHKNPAGDGENCSHDQADDHERPPRVARMPRVAPRRCRGHAAVFHSSPDGPGNVRR